MLKIILTLLLLNLSLQKMCSNVQCDDNCQNCDICKDKLQKNCVELNYTIDPKDDWGQMKIYKVNLTFRKAPYKPQNMLLKWKQCKVKPVDVWSEIKGNPCTKSVTASGAHIIQCPIAYTDYQPFPVFAQQIEIEKGYIGWDVKKSHLFALDMVGDDFKSTSTCGDGVCSGGETKDNCAIDCQDEATLCLKAQPTCGDGTCSQWETDYTKKEDCRCFECPNCLKSWPGTIKLNMEKNWEGGGCGALDINYPKFKLADKFAFTWTIFIKTCGVRMINFWGNAENRPVPMMNYTSGTGTVYPTYKVMGGQFDSFPDTLQKAVTGFCIESDFGAKLKEGVHYEVRFSDIIPDYKESDPYPFECGNGICEVNMGENELNCPLDCLDLYCPLEFKQMDCVGKSVLQKYLSKEMQRCQKECDDYYYPDKNRVCQECHQTCNKCKDNTSKGCTRCDSPTKLHNGECVAKCPAGFFEMEVIDKNKLTYLECAKEYCKAGEFYDPATKQCNKKCPPGTFTNAKKRECTKCHESCLECTEKGKEGCSKCDKQLKLQEKKCLYINNLGVEVWPWWEKKSKFSLDDLKKAYDGPGGNLSKMPKKEDLEGV